MAKISIALATYNGGKYLREQLESLAEQTLLPTELQARDDGSTDDTIAILEEFRSRAPFDVRIHRNTKNLGHGLNFVQTAMRCSGDWIAFCDQDDVWLPNKLAACAAEIAKAPSDLRLLTHPVLVVDEKLERRFAEKEVGGSTLHPCLSLPPSWFAPGFTLIFDRHLLGGSMSPAEETFARLGHDLWISQLANATGSIVRTPARLAMYRRHGGATTTGMAYEALYHGLWSRLRFHLRGCAKDYVDQTKTLHALAEALQGRAGTTNEREVAPLLIEAADRVRKYATTIEARVKVHGERSVARRMTSWQRLRSQGAYAHGDWPLGRSAALKDLLRVFVPAR